MRLRTVQMQTEGDYLPTDVDWNNKDVPHLNHVHSLVDDVTCVIERDVQASISLQKVLGITFPLILVHYDSGPNHQTHFVTILAWTMVTDHEFIPLSPTRTRAVTTYTVAARPFWMLFFPFIKALLQKNYRTLMSEDVPLRERRGWLRSIGYTFRGDDGPRDIRNSLPIGANNVLAPEPPTGETPVFAPVPLGDLDAGWTYLGRSDHLGLKLTREGDRIVAYARMCPHEGADLDPTPATDGCQVCPWHGRKLSPLAVLDLGDGAPSADTDWHHLAVDGDSLHVTVTNPGRAARAAAPAASSAEQPAG